MGVARISLDKKYKFFGCFQQDVDQTLPLGKIISIQNSSSHRDCSNLGGRNNRCRSSGQHLRCVANNLPPLIAFLEGKLNKFWSLGFLGIQDAY